MKKRHVTFPIFLFAVLICFVFLNKGKKGSAETINTNRYYYQQLEDYEKKAYDLIWEKNFETFSFEILFSEVPEEILSSKSTISLDRVKKALSLDSAYADDHEVSMYVQKDSGNSTFKCTVNKNTSVPEQFFEKEEEMLEQWAAVVLPEDDRYTKLRKLFNLLSDEITYQTWIKNDRGWLGRSVGKRLSILYGRGIVYGYQNLVKDMCDRWGIPCVKAENSNSGYNILQMEDGNWYVLDFHYANHDWEEHTILAGYREASSSYLYGDKGVKDGFFVYPEIEPDNYVYYGTNKDFSYQLLRTNQTEGDPIFTYEAISGTKTCIITGYKGLQKGDLVIPATIDGYTVVGIGDGAFLNCNGFTGKIVFPESITSIGVLSFAHCNGLTGELIFPSGLTKIGIGAFLKSKHISGDISFPDTITNISADAFWNCTGLSGNLFYPKNHKRCLIAEDAISRTEAFTGTLYLPDDYKFNFLDFDYTYFSSVVVSEDSRYHTSIDGALYNKEVTELVYCPERKEGTLIIPEGVVKVCDEAGFGCKFLKRIIFPSTIKEIGNEGFFHSWGLEDLYLPDTIQSIGENAFYAGAQGDVHLSESLKILKPFCIFGLSDSGLFVPDSVTKLESCCIGGSFRCVVLSDNITEIEDDSIIMNGFLDTIYYLESNQYLAEVAAKPSQMHWVPYAKKEDLYERIVEIDENSFPDPAFQDYVLRTVDVNRNRILEKYEAEAVIQIYTDNVDIRSLKGIEYFPNLYQICLKCSKIINLDTTHNSKLEHLTLWDTSVSYDLDENDVISLDVYPGFEKSRVKSLVGAEIDTKNNCLTKIVPGKNIQIVYDQGNGDNNVFKISTYKIERGDCGDNAEWEFYEGEGLLKINGTGAIWDDLADRVEKNYFVYSEKIKKIEVACGITAIGKNAFSGLSNVTEVILPEGLLTIDEKAFQGCEQLEKLILPESLTALSQFAFSKCDSLSIYCGRKRSETSIITEEVTSSVKKVYFRDDYSYLSFSMNGETLLQEIQLNGEWMITPRAYRLFKKGKGNYSYVFKGYDTNGDGIADSLPQNVEGDLFAVAVFEEQIDPEIRENTERFVERLYTVAMKRASDPSGADYWSRQLLLQNIDGAFIAGEFINSPEFLGFQLTNEEFINRLYKTFFDREGDEGGVNFWLNGLESGATTQIQVLGNFVNSEEFTDICSSFGIKRGELDVTKNMTPVEKFSYRLYTCILERAGEAEGMKYWAKMVGEGLNTPEEAAINFFTSDEYVNRNTNDAQYVEALYLTFMGRPSDQDGKDFWVSALGENRSTRTEALMDFCNSVEFTNVKRSFGL